MSTASTGADTQAALLATGLVGDTVQVLATLRDVDEWDDALAVAASIPRSRFARAAFAVCEQVEDRRCRRVRAPR